MTALPSISSLPSLPTERRANILDTLFEPSTKLHTLSVAVLHEKAFQDYPSLISAIGNQLYSLLDSPSTSDSDWLDAILAAHPRLGGTKVDSELSRHEQAHMQQDIGQEEAETLEKLNRQYEDAFLGLRYV